MAVDIKALADLMIQASGPGQVPQMPSPAPPPPPEMPVAIPVGQALPPPLPPPGVPLPNPGLPGPLPAPPPGPAQMGAPIQSEVPVDASGAPLPPMPPGMPEQQPEEPPSLIPMQIKMDLAAFLNERKTQIATQIAAAYGQPAGTVELDDTELLKLWRYREPAVNEDDLRLSGTPEGKITDMVNPRRRELLDTVYGWKAKVKFAAKMKKLDSETNEAYLGDIQYDPKKVPVKVK